MIKIYTLRKDFISLAYAATNGEFKQSQRPYLLLVKIKNQSHLLPMTHTLGKPYSYQLSTQSIQFDKAFPLINNRIISSKYYSTAMDPGTQKEIEKEYANIVRRYMKFLSDHYPTRFSVDHKIMIELQKKY